MSENARPSQAVITVHEVSQQPVREKHRYEPMAPREFRSTIPAHLLANLPEDERFMVETMSKLENQFNWLAEWAVKNNGSTLDLDERVMTLEADRKSCKELLTASLAVKDKVEKLWDWKQYFSGKWAVLAAATLIVVPILAKFLFDALVKWIKP